MNNSQQSALRYMASKMPSVNANHPNPIESLSVEDLTYLQLYLDQIRKKKQASTNVASGEYGVKFNHGIRNGKSDLYNQTGLTLNRANEIYNPIPNQMPIDWRTTGSNCNYASQSQLYTDSTMEPGCRGASCTRMGKKSQQPNVSQDTQYLAPMQAHHETNQNQIRNLDNIPNYHNPYEYGAKQNPLPPQYKPIYSGPYNVDPAVLKHMGTNNVTMPDHIRNINIESSLLQQESTHLPGQREITETEKNRFELLPFDPQDHKHIVWTDNMPRGGYATRSDRLEQ